MSDGAVVSWSPPVPPNGVILYYNVRITRADNGGIVSDIEMINTSTVDISEHVGDDGDYFVMVRLLNGVVYQNFFMEEISLIVGIRI